ncbi:MAG: hypothetical protein OXI90_14265 [Gammaproteobacteria bacterium]|nr:hypothetical protein [Gammaproteobacteria bacterium]
MEYLLDITVDEVVDGRPHRYWWKFRVADDRRLEDYIINLERASRPEAEIPYVLDASMLPLADVVEVNVEHLHATVIADSIDELHSAIITTVGGTLEGTGGLGRTLRT